ncbi:MAG: MFS transporter [bacterium]|nr:MFS transporter [bacterium]
MLFRFCLYGFLKNQRYFEPFFMLALLAKNLDFFQIGMLYAFRWLTLNLLEIPSGALADFWGRRRCMLVSFAAYILSFVTFAFANRFGYLALAMILFGIGDSFRTGTHKAMIFHWLRLQGRQQERTRIYGLTRSWSQLGSALSAVLAAVFLLITRDYRSVFLLAAFPNALNMLNIWSYPAQLEGEYSASKRPAANSPELLSKVKLPPSPVNSSPVNSSPVNSSPNRSAEKRNSLSCLSNQILAIAATAGYGIRHALLNAWSSVRNHQSLRRLLVESVAWEGVFHSVKDYLQPVILIFILKHWFQRETQAIDLDAALQDQTQADPATICTVAAVYTILFLLSARASRNAHMLVDRCGSGDAAARRVWAVTAMLYGCVIIGSLLNVTGVVVAAFSGLIILQNVWRPILIGRIDERADSTFGATILSIESQTQRIATMLLAPLIGIAMDWTGAHFTASSAWWPLGALGASVSLGILLAKRNAKFGESS